MTRHLLRHLGSTALLVLAATAMAHAAPLEYGLVSLGNAVERRSGVEVPESQRLFPAGLTVAGAFTYSTEPAYLIGTFPGRAGPVPSYGDFSLQLDLSGAPFRNDALYAVIGDQLCGAGPPTPGLPPPPALDCLVLRIVRTTNANAPLLGPEFSDGEGRRFGLIDVGLGWIEGTNGSGAFLNGIDVPATLPPAGTGDPTLSLLFRELNAAPGSTPLLHAVSFAAVQVAVVPVPASGWLLGTAIAVMARRRRLAHAGAP